MPELPRLKVKMPSGRDEEICDLEQAKYLIPFDIDEVLVVADGQVIESYDELVQLATQDLYKSKELLEVLLLPLVSGG